MLDYALSKHAAVTNYTKKAYNTSRLSWPFYVSVLALSDRQQNVANDLDKEKCRYNGDYEKTMDLQEKERQGLVVWMV